MRSHLFLAHSSFGILFKCNLNQFYGFQFNPSRLLLTSIVSSPSSSSCSYSSSSSVFSTLILKSSSSLFSQPLHRQTKLNFIPTRYYCENGDDHQINTDIEYEKLTVDKYKELISNENDAKLIEDILATYEILKYETGDVPSTIKVIQMYELLKMSPNLWPTTMAYLQEKEFNAKAKKHRKSQMPRSTTYDELQKIKDEGKKPDLGIRFDAKTGAPIYGEWLNSHFIRIRQYEYRCSFVSNLLASNLFGQRLIIDCDYDYNVIEAKKLAHDIQKAYSYNRTVIEPFNLTLTGLKSQILRDLLNKYTISLDSNYGNLGIDTYSETFTELFPDQKFIYLTSDAKNILSEFDEDSIYIIGGLSSNVHTPLSFKKAIAHKLPSYCFPTENLSFRAMKNAKCFDLAESTRIMCICKETKDIFRAVKSGISEARLKTKEEIDDEQRYRLNKLLSSMKTVKKFKPIRT